MKILNLQQIREADQYTIAHEPVLSIDLMERAASACCRWIENHFAKDRSIKIFCGPGNNGGDGLAIGRMLIHSGYNVEVYTIRTGQKTSEDFKENEQRLLGMDTNVIREIKVEKDIPFISGDELVVDTIFGSGLNRPVNGIVAKVIEEMNGSNAFVISIDIPSGLHAENPVVDKAVVVQASVTLTFQFPKLSFMFPSGGKFCGKFEVLDIRLHPQFIRQLETKWNYFTHQDAVPLLSKRLKFSHKGNYGHALLISGSKGKMGAAVLASKGCLRTGVGLLTVHVPGCGTSILQTTVPEAMLRIDMNENCISDLPDFSNFSAVGIGPGIGTDPLTWETLRHLLYSFRKPVLLDADAINILSQHPDWMEYIPENSILTPHIKEFSRLTKETKNDFERMEIQMEFAKKYKVFVVLKGAHTCTVGPDGNAWFNSTGNPGMARGGSGDVLTGIILSLLAQGYSSHDATRLGVYIHGLAGDAAAKIKTEIGMLPKDLIKYLPIAFRQIQG